MVATDSAAITPQVINLIKDTTASEEERSTGENFPFDYTLTIDIADGETVTALDITDVLPNSFVYVASSVMVDSSAAGAVSGLSITDEPVAGSPQNAPDNDFLIEFASVTGTAADNDIVVTYTVYIDELDADSNPVLNATSGDDVVVMNDSEVAGMYDGGPVGDNDAMTDQLLEQQSISIQKDLAIVNDTGGGGATPGDTLEYTMTVQVSDFFEFSNVILDDNFSDGQLFDGSFTPTYSINEGGTNTAGSFGVSDFTVTQNSPGDGTTDVHFDVFSVVPDGVLSGDVFADATFDGQPTTFTVTYRTVIQESFTDTFPSGDQSVDTGDILTNDVTVTGTLPSGQTESDDSSASISIEGPVISKAIYAIEGDTGRATEDIVAGRTITYRLTFDMPTADFENLVITDFLPLPIYDASEIATFSNTPTATAPPAGTATYGPLHTLHTVVPATDPPIPVVDADANSIGFDFDDFDVSPSQAATIDILFTVTALDVLMADNLFLTNQANATFDSTNNGAVSSDAIVQNQVAAPELVLSKGIVSTTATSPTFTPATVGPVAFAAPGIGPPAFGGGINSTNLAADPIDSDLTDADAGDLVKFAIVVENQGGADGFDLLIQDSIPSQYVVPGSGLNLEVVDGDGNAIPFTGAAADLFTTGITLTDPSATVGAINSLDEATVGGDGSNIVVITYDLELDVAVSPDRVYTNTALIGEFGAVDGGADWTAGSTNPDWEDIATIEVTNVSPAKSFVTTSEAHTSGTDVTIGEIVRYQLAVEVPEGTLPNFQIRDNLPTGFTFVDDGTATTAFISNGGGISSTDIGGSLNLGYGTTPAVVGNSVSTPATPMTDDTIGSSNSTDADPDSYSDASNVFFKFGDVVNADSDADSEFIVVEFNAIVSNVSGIDDGDTLSNNFSVFVNGTNEATSNNASVDVVEPSIANVDKSASVPSGDAGDTVTFTVTYSNTGNANAYETLFEDTLPSEYTLNVASVNVVLGGGATGLSDTSAGNKVEFSVSDIPVGGTVSVTYDATLNASVQPGETLTNTGCVGYTSLPGSGTAVNPTGSMVTAASGAATGERDGSGSQNDYSDCDTADVNVNTPSISKTLTGTSITNGGNTISEVVIGELATYQVQTTIPEGTITAANLVDTLDAGLTFVSLDSITTSAGVSSSNVAIDLNDSLTIPTSVMGQDVTFDFGDLTNSDSNNATPETLTLEYTVRVDNVSTNQGEGVGTMLDNSAVFEWMTGAGTVTSTPADAADIEVIEADLNVDKSVAPTTGDAGDTFTYTIVISHDVDSDTGAYDATFQDSMPANVNWSFPTDVTITHSASGDLSGIFQQTGNDLETIPGNSFDLLLGETLTITIAGTLDDTVAPGDTLTNTSTVDWTSIDGVDANERDGADGAGGALDDYEDSDTADITITAATIAKSLVDTSIVSANNTSNEVVIGETAQYRVLVTIPEGVTPAAQVVDDLDLGLEFVSLDSIATFSGVAPTTDVTSSVGAFASTALFDPVVVGAMEAALPRH